jgi:hypothetical protein
MKAAIAQLEISLENLETNIPIRRSEGDVEQADAWAVNADEIRQALVTLNAASNQPSADILRQRDILFDALNEMNEYYRGHNISGYVFNKVQKALLVGDPQKPNTPTWKHPLEDCCPPHFINDGLSAANEYWMGEYISLRDKLIKEITDHKIALSRIHQVLLDARACGCEISLEDAISDAENSLQNTPDQERKSPASDGSI